MSPLRRSSTALIALALGSCSLIASAPRSSTPPNRAESFRNELTQKPSPFRFAVQRDVADLAPQRETTLAFTIERAGVPVQSFKVAHEKLMHFIVVRNDLREFQHLHPDLDASSGQFRVPVTFPEVGTYALFADFEPQEGEPTVLRYDVTIGTASTPTAIMADTTPQEVEGYTVTPSVETPLPTSTDQMFIFGITKGGEPVEDLQNYLGAKGLAVILKEGSLDFAHGHPSEQGGGHGGMVTPGPGEVIFMASLPTPGRYRVFQQYRPEGRLITVAHTYEVTNPPSDISTDASEEGDYPTQELSVEAFQWGFNPDVIRVQDGTRLVIHLTTRDVAHGFNVSGFDVSETILPGKTTTSTFVADKKGTFPFGCDIACVTGHPEMAERGGRLIVE